jgi:sigma-54 dependent transcriptional regulator, acetoin dehydrogenase operon transcriptional activator AcoR
MPEGLIEAELFGYADGAFTGGRKGGAHGRIEQAHGGVLFLDEIGDMAVGMQSRLLRVVQERVVTRIGDSREVPVDVLILSATHCRLDALVARHEFREDLYYRLAGFTFRLPPLRDRTDIADIASGFLLRHDAQLGARGQPSGLDAIIRPRAFALLLNYGWPGNIRQLEQTIRALVAMRSPNMPIDINDLPDEIRMQAAARSTEKSAAEAGKPTLAAAQDALIRQVLSEHGGNVSAAARALGVSRTTLYSRLNRHSGRGDA